MHKNHSPSPRLLRSRSRNTTVSPPKTRPNTSNSCSSHSKTIEKDQEKIIPKYRLVKRDTANFDNRSQASHNSINTNNLRRKIRSAPTSPSAWALSPGRANIPFASLVPSSPNINYGKTKIESTNNGGKRRSGERILNFFGLKKKVPKEQEEEFHRFRILQNKLLQWRFVNARLEKSTRGVKKIAEMKLFNVWLQLYYLRKSLLEKRLQMQKLGDEIKFYQTIVPQMFLLVEWSKIDYKNTEAVDRLNRKLSSIPFRLPLVRGAKGDVTSMCDALNEAFRTTKSIQTTAIHFLPQVEKICFLVTELALLQNQQEECLNELESWVSTILSLQEEERCLRAQLLQSTD